MHLEGQRFFGPSGVTLVVAFVTALLPTSIDLYLPALPRLSKEFATSEALVNLTLILFFVHPHRRGDHFPLAWCSAQTLRGLGSGGQTQRSGPSLKEEGSRCAAPCRFPW